MSKKILRDTFWYLLGIYGIFVLMIAFGVMARYSLQFHILAFVVAALGITILPREIEREGKKKWHYVILAGILLVTLLLRWMPYWGNEIPLGYDAGLYRYGIAQGLGSSEMWILGGGMEPGFLYLMSALKVFFTVDALLKGGFIFFVLVLGAGVWLFTRELAGSKAGIFAALIYALSAVQFKVFDYLYYKNVIGLAMVMFAFTMMLKYERSGKKRWLIGFAVMGGLVLAMHRPTAYIFGLAYFAYAFVQPWKGRAYDVKKMMWNVVAGIVMLVVGGAFYLGRFAPAVTQALPWVTQGFITPGESPGTFISFFTYQFSVLFYLPLALMGLFYFLKKKEFNIIVLWTVITLAIVYFQFFFFNRFIIHLDVALIVLAGVGCAIVVEEKKKSGAIAIGLLMVAGAVMAYDVADSARPLIGEEGLRAIERIADVTEEDALIMSITSNYSPWLKGYSNRTVIAPGMFDENTWDEGEWKKFWSSQSEEETREMMEVYEGPIYLFAGDRRFNNPCFTVFDESAGGTLYKYGC